MYTEFYDLREKPFDLNPSSRFLYLGETHREALALLTYGVSERKGFGLLTGEVGTGKTTIVHALLAGLDQSVRPVHLSNPLMSPREFLDYLARKALGRETTFHSKAEFLIDFETFLGDGLKSDKNFLLIIDEAHKLSLELLEEIRLLSNMETAEEKLINIFLVGQPELRDRLRDPRCKALFQRITIHYHLKPLDEKSVAEYIRTRLRVAGAKAPDKIFPETVVKAIHQYSKGYPREINNISDNLLLLGYAQGKKKITAAMVTECCTDMSLETSSHEEDGEERKLSQEKEATPFPLSTHWKRFAFILAILTTALGLAIGLVRIDMSDEDPIDPQPEPFAATEEEGALKNIPTEETAGPIATEDPAFHTESDKLEQGPPVSDASPEQKGPPSALAGQPERTSWKTVTVREGQTLRQLALEAYGRADETTLMLLKEMNPSLEDINLILAGQEIALPPLPVVGQESDDLLASHVPRSEHTNSSREFKGDIYDEIDREILQPLKEERPGCYRDFWEGLLHSDSGEGLPYAKGAGAKEAAEKRLSHFVQSAPDIESTARSLPGETGILYPGVLKAYGRLSEIEPLHYAPLLKDSVIYQETWQGDATLIREIDLSGPRSFSGPEAASLQATLDEIMRRVTQVSEQGQMTKDQIESAIDSLQQLLVKEPSLYEAHYNLGVLYQTMERPEEAGEEYRRALEQDPRNTKALLNLGLLHLQKGKVKEAERHFQRLNALDPQFAGSFYLLGICKHRRRAYAEAEADLKRSIDLLPSFLYPYIELGSVQRKLGREEEARKSFLVVVHHPNASLRELHKLAYCLLESGWLQEAHAVFDRILKKGDPDYEVWNNRAVAYLRRGELELARSDLTRAIEKDPARPEAFNNMGMAYVQDKAYEDAATYFLHASRLGPSFPGALLNAAVVYGQYLGNAEKATACARDYLDRGGTFQRHMLQTWLGST